ncbi:MAG TPA: hypothetical protein EYG20_03050, partial [Alcanivorax sp.]|nr:hypothetical protein [Alcanivorax sp.]
MAPDAEGQQFISVPVYLDATFGFSGERRMQSEYTLYRDRTPPTLSIVSPQDGDFIAFDERADVLIQSFDRYGIESVQVSRSGGNCEQGGVWTTLEDPRRYSFTISADDFEEDQEPLVPISVRATDPNGNCSSEQVTLRAYDPSEGAPEVVILSPRNGEVFYENEEVTFEVALRQVTSAQLCMDVGGEEAEPDSCVSISRTPDQDERRFVKLRLPSTGEDIVVIARIQSGSLRGYAFLNVRADQGMPETPYLDTVPATQVFTGTGVQVRSGMPEGMTDFSDDSYVQYTYSAGSAGLILPMAELDRWLPVSRDGDSVVIEAVLNDRAGNEASLAKDLGKLPFFASDEAELWQTSTPGDPIQALVDTPHGLVWAAGLGEVTLWQEGALAADELETLPSKTRLLSFQFSGTALYAEVEQQGGRFVRRYPMTAEGWAMPEVQPLTGRMLAVQGDLLWQQLGQSVDAMVFSQGQAMPLAGVTFNEPLRQSSAWHDRLLVLTESGIHVLAVTPTETPRLVRESLHALEAAEGFAVDGEHLHVSSDDKVQRFRILPEQAGLVLQDEMTLPGLVTHLLADGAMTWAYVEGEIPGQIGQWWLLEEGEVRGILPQRDAPTLTRILPGRLVWTGSNDNGQAVLLERSVNRELAMLELSVLATPQPSGLQLQMEGLDDRNVHLLLQDMTGDPVPVQAIAPTRWQVPGYALNGISSLTATLVQHGREDSVAFAVPAPQGGSVAVSPPSGSVVAEGAKVPVVLQLAELAMAGEVQLLRDMQQWPMAQWGEHAWQWLQLPGVEQSNTLNFSVDGNTVAQAPTLGTAVRQGSDIGVTLLRPENNISLMSGETFPVRFTSRDEQGRPFRHAEIMLLDFEGLPLQITRLSGEDGNLQWLAPRVDQREVFTLRVRAYYGDDWSYNDAQIGLSVMPVRHLAAPVIQSPLTVRAGASVTVSLAEPWPSGQTSLEVLDASETVLVRGDARVTLQAPPYSDNASPLQVRARAEDGLGNHSEASRSITVLPGYTVQSLGALNADHVLSDVEQLWLARGRDLLGGDGQLLRRFDGVITSLDRLGDRLLLSITGQGFVIVDPAEQFSTVGTLPLAEQISSVSLTGDMLFAIVDEHLRTFAVSGNALTPEPLLDTDLAQEIGQEGVRAVSLDAEGALVLTDAGLFRAQRQDNQWEIRSLLELPGARHLLRYGESLLIADDSGGLTRLDRLGATRVETDGIVSSMVLVGSDLLVSYENDPALHIFEAGVAGRLDSLGQYPLNEPPNTLTLHGEQLYTGAGHYQLVLPSEMTLISSLALPDTAAAVAAHDGEFLLAGSLSGAAHLRADEGGWETRMLGQPFTTSVEAVAVDADHDYVLERDTGLLRKHEPGAVLPVQTVNHGSRLPGKLLVAGELLVAVAGDTLLLHDRDDLSIMDSLTVIPGDNIVSITAHGEVLYIATASRRLFRLSGVALPVQTHLLRRVDLLDGGAAQLDHLVVSGGHLFFTANQTLNRLDLATFETIALPGTAVADALTFAHGSLWVALRDGSENRVQAINPRTLSAEGLPGLSQSARVRALTFSGAHLLVTQQGGPLQLYHLAAGDMRGHAAPLSPVPSQVFRQGETLPLSLTDAAGISSVRYLINDRLVSARNRAPFEDRIPVPGFLRNGQPFSVVAEVRHIDGVVTRSVVRNALLQGEDLPANPFHVVITEPTAGGISHMPKPLVVRADVVNSSLPVEQVEFYLSETTDRFGAYQIDGKHYGPEYVIHRDYDESYNGRWVKVRAIDMFGNSIDSEPVMIQRAVDAEPPIISDFILDEPWLQVSPGVVVEKHPFTLRVSATDSESGIDQALLYRNGAIVAAGFGDGDLTFTERTAQPDDVLNYSLHVSDKAGNVAESAFTLMVAEDHRPIPVLSEIVESVLEQGPLAIQVAANDDIAVRKLNVTWEGLPLGNRQFEGYQQQVGPLILNGRDHRIERVAGSTNALLVIEAEDDIGQVGRLEQNVVVVEDQVPNLAALVLNQPASNFYGSTHEVQLSNLSAVDEGLDPAEIAIRVAGETIDARSLGVGQSSLSMVFRLPDTDIDDDQFRFRVRYTDHLGQWSESEEFSVQMSRFPNQLRFDDGEGALNPRVISAGDTPVYRVQALDVAARPVAAQIIDWQLLRDGTVVASAESVTEINGATDWAMPSDLATGVYDLQARIRGFDKPAIATALRLRVEAGQLAMVRVSHIEPTKAGETRVLQLQALDSGGNAAVLNDDGILTLALPEEGFQFGFINDAVIDSLERGQRVTLTLRQSEIALPVRVGTTAGLYAGAVALHLAGNGLPVLYDHDGDTATAPVVRDQLPFEVISAGPARIALSLEGFDNHPQGEPDVLEADETASIRVQLEDIFGNRVYSFGEPPVALGVTLSVDNNATVESESSASIALGAGQETVAVTTDTPGTVTLTVTGDSGEAGELFSTPLPIEFFKRRPAILSAAFEPSLNSEITPLVLTFNEPVEFLEAQPQITMQIQGEDVEGIWDIDGQIVRFIPDAPLPLGVCADLDTSTAAIQGMAEQDRVLAQQLTPCTFHVSIEVPELLYGLEGDVI